MGQLHRLQFPGLCQRQAGKGQLDSNNNPQKAIAVGEFVLINVPILLTGSYRGDIAQVDSNGYSGFIKVLLKIILL